MDNTKKIKFSVPTNWQNDLIPKIRKDDVDEIISVEMFKYI